MMNFFNFSNPFLYIGLAWFVFFGWRAVYIHDPKDKFKNHKLDWWIYQFFFNGSGALVGWIIVSNLWEMSLNEYKVEHLIALILGFLGITGNLPAATLLGNLINKIRG